MNVLPLLANKSVKIVKNPTNYSIICLKREITPGVYSKINVEKNKWYIIELCCTKFGYGTPGLWIADPNKKTLFYGNYFTKTGRGYLKRSFYTGNYSNLLIGILVKNANIRSGFILEKLSVTEVDIQDTEVELNEEEKKKIKVTDIKTSDNVFNNLFETKINCTDLLHNQNKSKNDNSIRNVPRNVLENILEINKIIEPSSRKTIIDNVLIEEIESTEEIETSNVTNKSIYTIKKTYGDVEFNIDIKSQSIKNFEMYPISLGIPEEMVLENINEKSENFFKYNLEEPLLSKYEKTPEQFYKDLEKSRFIVISKHEYGIDEPIYYEALSKGCIPLFINDIPEKSSVFLPKEVINSIKNVEGVNLGWINESKFSKEGFDKILKHLLDYTKDFLTTKSVADYLIHIADKEVHSVLFLANSQEGGDFLLQQSLLHGLKNKLGPLNVIDYPKATSLYRDINPNEKIRLGLPYNNTVIESNTSRGRINKRIENREFDLVIVMGVFTKKDRKRLKLDNGDFPLSHDIKTYYDKNEIFFIDGTSNNTDEPILSRLYKYANQGVYFYKDFV